MIGKCLDILKLVLTLVMTKLNALKNEKLQKETNAIEEDPYIWLSDHFDNGMHTKSTPDKTGNSKHINPEK